MGRGKGGAASEGDDAQSPHRVINLEFFPSRQLAFYTVRLYLTRSLAVLIGLVLVLMALDLLGESGKILAVPGNGDADLWRYVGLRIPLLVSRFLPFSILLGTLIVFVGLNQNSEVVAMKAAGISAHQMLAPLVVASVGIAIVAFTFNETVVVRSARVVNAWSDNDYKPIPPESGIISNVWVNHGNDLVRARQVAGRGAGLHADGITIYERQGGALQRIVDADRAVPAGDAWRLEKVRIYDSGMNLVRKAPEATGLQGLAREELTLAKVDPDETGFFPLMRKIDALEAAGKPTTEARAGLWHKISGPLSILLMPLLAAVAAFGLARSGQVLLRATIGMALGFAYFVADNFSLAMGNVGAYPPVLAAWAPFFLFLLVGEAVLIRSEE
jgi:lipopolysaccharide export system permease protein